MIFSKSIFVLLVLFGLMASSCSDCDDGAVLARYDDVGFMYSPTPLSGSVEYISTMTPEKIKVVTVDELLNPIDSFEIAATPELNKTSVFSVNERDYEYPYVKLVPIFQVSDKFQMEFPQYVRLTENNSQIKLNLYASLASGRIETLVRKDKKSYAAAEKQALSELATYFDDNAIKTNRNFRGWNNVWNGDCLNDLKPYVYCRHEISDSVFNSDVKAFRESFAKDGLIDSSWVVRAADTWLSTFKVVAGKNGKPELKAITRDTSAGIMSFDRSFFEKIYGVSLKSEGDTTITIDNKWSSLKGRKFIYDKQKLLWRLSDTLEDTLGICFSTKDSVAKNNGKYYLCAKESVVWKEESRRDTLLNKLYKECRGGNANKAGYLRDSLFVCICEKEKCAWTDKYVDSVFAQGDSLYSSYILAMAFEKFGPCEANLKGKVEKLKDKFVWCSGENRYWNLIDSLQYYLGFCSADNYKGEHNGVYYACDNFEEYGVFWKRWTEIPAPVYYGDTCSDERRAKKYVAKYGDDYFLCVNDVFIDKNDNVMIRNIWRELEESERIPPVINMDACGPEQQYLKVNYDGKYYECARDIFYKWVPVDEDSLLPPEKDGLICTDSLYGTLKRYGDDYYECEYLNWWRQKMPLEAALLAYRDSLGECDTISKKSLYWNEKNSAFFGCLKSGDSYKWSKISLAPDSYYALPESFEKKKFAGGIVEHDSTYTVTADGITYRFSIFEMNWVLSHVVIAGKGYDAYFYNGKFFLHSERGTEKVRIDAVESKSESYDSFFANFKSWAKDCSECRDVKVDVDTAVYMERYNENAYMDWTHASTFCPEGFHIPSSTEFSQVDFISYRISDMTVRNDAPIVWEYKMNQIGCTSNNTVFFDIFWTSTEKDDGTQKCFELAWHNARNELDRRIVDCPKDLYPMVQTLCVKDK